MQKLSYRELKNLFIDREKEKDAPKTHLKGAIVITEDSFTQPYSLEARTYVVSSDNKAFRPCNGGYSIFGSSMDGSDSHVRLEAYLACERGGKDGWKVDYCYLLDKAEEATSNA